MANEIIEQQTGELANISEETKALLAKAAQQQAEEEQSSIPFLSLKGKKFSIGDEKIGTKMQVVILADVFDNSYYDRPYDPDVQTPPACFSIYKDIDNAFPHESSPTPISKPGCAECAFNKFESAPNGKGKACRNGRRILVASIHNDKVNLADLAIANISPTALKGFSRFVKAITITKGLPLWAVASTLSFDEDSDWPLLQASFDYMLSGPEIDEIASRLGEFEECVSVPYDTSGYEPPPAVDETKAKKNSKMS